MTSLTKNPHPQAKNFFRVQTRRLATSFETFTGSVQHTGPVKVPRKATCAEAFFFQKSPNPSGRQRVNQIKTYPGMPLHHQLSDRLE